MKKIWQILFLLTTFTVGAQAETKGSGFYLGVSGALNYNQSVLKPSFSDFAGVPALYNSSLTLNFNKLTTNLGALGGYLCEKRSYFIFGEAFYRTLDKKETISLRRVSDDNAGTLILNPGASFSLRKLNTWGATVGYGADFKGDLGAFVSLDALVSQFKISYNSQIESGHQTKTVMGAAPGVGLLYRYNSINVRLKYSYDIYQSVKTRDLNNNVQNVNIYAKLQPADHNIQLSVAFVF